MGLLERDYMRRPLRTGPPLGGPLGIIVFIAVLTALVFAGMPARSKFYKKHISKPFHHMMKNLKSMNPYHKKKHGR